MMHKPAKSVHRLDRVRPQPVGKPEVPAGPGPARPIAEELRPAGSVLPRRPPGRPRRDGKPAGSVLKPPPVPGPGPQVQTPAPAVPYVPIDVGILAGTFKGSFSFLAGVLSVALKVPAEELEVSDKQARDLAEAWKPIFDHYKVNLGIGGLWVNAIGTTFGILGPKVQKVMARRGVKLPNLEQPAEARIVPSGVN